MLDEVFPAKISLDVNEADLTAETIANVVDIVEMIKRILAAGVGIIPTLRSYRSFEKTTPITTALFDRSHLTFDLPDVRHSSAENNFVASAAFERSRLTFGLFDVRRTFTDAIPADAVLFEHTQVQTAPVPPEPQTFKGVDVTEFVLFEYSRISITSCY